MSTEILAHLQFLVTSFHDGASESGKSSSDEWRSLAIGKHNLDDDSQQEYYETEPSSSLLQIYNNVAHHKSIASGASTTFTKLLQKPNQHSLFESLLRLLSSDRPDNAISEELAEVVGFDNIELVSTILDGREAIKNEIRQHVLNSTSTEQSNSKSALNTSHQLQNLSAESARIRMEQKFQAEAHRPLFSGVEQSHPEILPHVYSSTSLAQGNVLSQLGSKYMLPIGTERHTYDDFEEVTIPPAKAVPIVGNERLISVLELDSLARGCFPGYVNLNRVQSIVYPTAYESNENMLICAPTGAGKTDVAMLAILRVIDQHRLPLQGNAHLRSTIDRNRFKIIYVAPMKALASEIVRKLGKRLKWLEIEVRELTGDMQLTKAEISKTQIIVTTPEKWDVVTRKPSGEGELASSLKLLIIDEVHLLNEERGAVIETIIARTLRQVESSQSMIRIVGLSATLPNYIDVGEFLSVSPYKGLFYFDSSFRPVPLEQHFIGIKGKPGSQQSRKNLDRVTFQKVSELVAQGHQVMVFVHARKETVKTAVGLREMSVAEGNFEDFTCEDHPQWSLFRKSIGESRNKEMKLLFDSGFGIHHAGMLRSDRNMMERMFEARAIKVLCCTATLAWGVNLPAHAVIIKGTQVYDSSKGNFVDLSVLDVLQVFGRAGRPGLESSGEGYICTTEDKLAHYLDAVTSQIPIESQFQGGLIDALNAEISLGTVANVGDAVQWLGYTYLFVRMKKNPFIYGISRDTLVDDPQLGGKRSGLIAAAAQKLADARMIVFDHLSDRLNVTELGRIAAKYYLRYTSIEIFNKEFRPRMSEADVLAMLSMSTEFDQIQARESEQKELELLLENVPCDIKGGTDDTRGKVNILLQGFISRHPLDDFALVSDMAYVAQNAGRIIRALLEIAISQKWANVSTVLMSMSKAVEKRLWPFEQPLKQFELKPNVLYGLQEWADEWSVSQLAGLDAASLGKLVHLNEQHGAAILSAAKQFPTAKISYTLYPLAAGILKITLDIARSFTWNNKVHGSSEPFWIWVEDHEGLSILQLAHLAFREDTGSLKVDFVISVPDGQSPPSVTIRWVSDRWIGAEDELVVSFESMIMPMPVQCHTQALSLPFLSVSIFGNSLLESIVTNHFQNLNMIQTHSHWSFFHSKSNSLLCGPAGGGKSTVIQTLAWMTALNSRNAWILIVVPRKSVAQETISEMQILSDISGVSVEQPAVNDILKQPKSSTIRVVIASHLLHAFSSRSSAPSLTGLELVLCENLEQLDSKYEMAISLLRHATQSLPTRFTGVSSSLNDPSDLADWIEVDPFALFSFLPRERDQALTFSPQTFTIPYSTSLFKTMAKPAHTILRSMPAGEPAIIFVPSRGQCRTVASDLVTQSTLEMGNVNGYLPEGANIGYLEGRCSQLQDQTLADFISKGIGFFHLGLEKRDRKLMFELYAEGVIRVLIVPKEACWIVPVRASAVIVMGTQYIQFGSQGTERQLCDYQVAELVRMQSRAFQHSKPGLFCLFCPPESLDNFTKFLNDGLPLESQLLETDTLQVWLKMQRDFGNSMQRQGILDLLSFTFLARRISSNPSYYGFGSRDMNANLSRVVDKLLSETQKSISSDHS